MKTRERKLQPKPETITDAGLCLLGCEILHQMVRVSISVPQEEEVAHALGVELARAREDVARLRTLIASDERNSAELLKWLRFENKLLRYVVGHQNSMGDCTIDIEELLAMVRP
jgi:hypothetical protein